MGLNDKITERFQVTADISKQEILNSIGHGKQRQLWTDFLVATAINYKAIKILGNRLETIRMPSMINPFRPYGKITIDIEEIESNKTNLKCEILPYDGILPIAIGLLIGFLTLWSIAAFWFARDLNVLLMVVPSWIVFGLVIYLGYLYTKHGLRDYSKILINEITRSK